MRNQSLGPLVNGFLWTVLYLSGLALTCQAEIIVDGSLGTPRTELTGPRFAIGAELGRTIERNLFHSFEAFNIGNSEAATFTGPSAVQNILSRVTGGSGSTINGVLRSEIQGANLFVINPAGISFGSGAQLEVTGAFHATTADFIGLGDGVRFGALPSPDDALLTTASPAAFGFLDGELDRSQPGQIEVNQASRQNQSVKNLSLVGGPVKIVGSTIIEPDLTLNIVSVGGAGEATISSDLITLQEGQRRGPITVTASTIDTTGADGGHIHLVGGDVQITERSFIDAQNQSAPGRGIKFDVDNLELNQSRLSAGPSSEAPQGVKGSDVDVTARDAITLADSSSIATARPGPANAGSITIETGGLKLDNNSRLLAGNLSDGPGGDITVTATGTVDIKNGSAFRTTTFFSREAGNISITARSLNLTNAATINADVFISGAGKIILKAMELISLDEKSKITSRALASGDAGEVSITTDVLNLSGGAAVEGQTFATVEDAGKGADINIVASKVVTLSDGAQLTASTEGRGAGGSVTVSAPEGEVAVTGVGSAITTASLGTDQNAGIAGPAGRIMIEAGRLVVRDGGEVSASTATNGPGGDLEVIADSVLLDGQNSGVSVDSQGTASQSGNSGNLRLVANDTVEIRNQAAISADTFGPGAGGNAAIESPDIRLSSGGTISASTRGSGRGGNVEINEINGKSGTVLLSGPSTSISSETTGEGDAGSVAIKTGRLTVRDGAAISASTSGNGKGGSVNIEATNIELLDGGEIRARSDSINDSAESGNLSIRADEAIRIFNGSSVSVETAEADAGDIDLDVGFLLHLRDRSSITTSAAVDEEGQGQGEGGDINIDPVFTVLDGGSRIVANALEGSAGNIRIRTNFLFQSPDSEIKASNRFGVEGNVDIDSPDTDVISSALELPASFLDVADLLSDRCSARTQKGASRFIVSGRGGVPPGPETVLPSYSLNLSEAPKINQGATAISKDQLCNR